MTRYGYKTEKTGFSFGTAYEQYENIFFSPTVSNYYEKITTNSKASAAKKKQDGDYFDLLLNYDLSLNKLNQNFNPTEGYKFTFSQELPLHSEEYTLINTINYSKYYETQNNTVYSFRFLAAASNSISNDDARITKKNYNSTKKAKGISTWKNWPKRWK